MKKLFIFLTAIFFISCSDSDITFTQSVIVVNTLSRSIPYVAEYNFMRTDTIEKVFLCSIDENSYLLYNNYKKEYKVENVIVYENRNSFVIH